MAFSLTYMAAGLLLCFFSHELADWLNCASVRFYASFPKFKWPFSHLAGSRTNYKISYYFFRIFGAFMAIVGVFFLGAEMLGRQ